MAGHRPLTSLTAHYYPSIEPKDLCPIIHRIFNSRKFEGPYGVHNFPTTSNRVVTKWPFKYFMAECKRMASIQWL